MRTVLITGAYRGLGYEVGRQLSKRGWNVILTARRKEQGAAAAAKLKNASFLELDITDSASVARAAKEVSNLDVLVNKAGVIVEGDEDILFRGDGSLNFLKPGTNRRFVHLIFGNK